MTYLLTAIKSGNELLLIYDVEGLLIGFNMTGDWTAIQKQYFLDHFLKKLYQQSDLFDDALHKVFRVAPQEPPEYTRQTIFETEDTRIVAETRRYNAVQSVDI